MYNITCLFNERIIVPSIPGFGYSTPLTKTIDAAETAQYFDALMRFIHNDQDCEYFIHGNLYKYLLYNQFY